MESNTSVFGLRHILENQVIRIPSYQRGYSWKLRQLEQFFDDVKRVLDNPKSAYHYFGAIYLHQSKENNTFFYVVDGQQRITTCILFLMSLRKFLKKDFNTDSSEIVQKIENLIIGSDVDNPKFSYDSDEPSRIYLEEIIYKNYDEENFGIDDFLTQYISNIKFSYDYFEDKIRNLVIGDIDVANKLFKVFEEKLFFTIISLPNIFNINVVFDTLNNRGLDLSFLELIKNRSFLIIYYNYEKNKITKEYRDESERLLNKLWINIFIELGKQGVNGFTIDKTQELMLVELAWKIYFRKDDVNYDEDKLEFNQYKASFFEGYQEDLLDIKLDPFKTKTISIERLFGFLEFFKKITEFYRELKSENYQYFSQIINDEKYEEDIITYLSRLNKYDQPSSFTVLFVLFFDYGKVKNFKDTFNLLKALERFVFIHKYIYKTKDSALYKLIGVAKFLYAKQCYKLLEIAVFVNSDFSKKVDEGKFRNDKIVSQIEVLIQKDIENSDVSFYKNQEFIRLLLIEFEGSLRDNYGERPSTSFTFNSVYKEFKYSIFIVQADVISSPADTIKVFKSFADYSRKIIFTKQIGSIGNLILSSNHRENFSNHESWQEIIDVGYSITRLKQFESLINYDFWTVDSVEKRAEEFFHYMNLRWSLNLNKENIRRLTFKREIKRITSV